LRFLSIEEPAGRGTSIAAWSLQQQKFLEEKNHMKLFQLAGMIGLIALTGCAHSTMRGSVAMKASDDEAHVCLGDDEVKVGDKLTFFKNVCASPRSKASLGESGGCTKERLGEGEIVRLLNRHYSIARVNQGVPFEEGTIVEKN
jgi:hypothetical protein